MVKNESGIHPKGYRILVLPEEVEKKTASGIITVSGTTEKMEEMAQTIGVVIEVGQSAYKEYISAGFEPWCQVGDRVTFAKYGGLLNTGKDGKKYRVLNDMDIVSVVEEGVK